MEPGYVNTDTLTETILRGARRSQFQSAPCLLDGARKSRFTRVRTPLGYEWQGERISGNRCLEMPAATDICTTSRLYG